MIQAGPACQTPLLLLPLYVLVSPSESSRKRNHSGTFSYRRGGGGVSPCTRFFAKQQYRERENLCRELNYFTAYFFLS
jgi:hypothetical protein